MVTEDAENGEHKEHGRDAYRRVITVYGRKSVLEALRDPALDCSRLHLADSNRRGGIVGEILDVAQQRQLQVVTHSRQALSRISRNGKQDQGVALDVRCQAMAELAHALTTLAARPRTRLLALDGVTNPQNVGMVLRSAVAAGIDGVLYADRGNPALGPLVIKASAGTVFRAPLLRCASPVDGIAACAEAGFTLYRLRAGAPHSLFDAALAARALFVLGGESDGVSEAVAALPGEDLSIPMANGVESLNVAVSAALLCYAARYFDR
jgi:23S rRNA (guanosine2251-2'-O)-methyltransferase